MDKDQDLFYIRVRGNQGFSRTKLVVIQDTGSIVLRIFIQKYVYIK